MMNLRVDPDRISGSPKGGGWWRGLICSVGLVSRASSSQQNPLNDSLFIHWRIDSMNQTILEVFTLLCKMASLCLPYRIACHLVPEDKPVFH